MLCLVVELVFHKCYLRLLCFLLAFKGVYGFIKSSFVDTFSGHVASCDSVQACVPLFGLVGVGEPVIEISSLKNWDLQRNSAWLSGLRRRDDVQALQYVEVEVQISLR